MGKLLRNLLKSPMFVIGVSIFVLTLLIAIFGPLFYNVDNLLRNIFDCNLILHSSFLQNMFDD